MITHLICDEWVNLRYDLSLGQHLTSQKETLNEERFYLYYIWSGGSKMGSNAEGSAANRATQSDLE